MPFTLNGVPVASGQPFNLVEVQYPANVLDLWPRSDLESIGLVWVEPEPVVLTSDQLCAAVDAERDRRLATDFVFDFGAITAIDDQGQEIEAGVRSLQMRPEDRSNWQTALGVAHTAVLSGAPGTIVALRAEDNWNIQTTALQVMAAMAAMAAHGSALLFAGGAIKSAIRAAEDPAAIDITTGWPG